MPVDMKLLGGQPFGQREPLTTRLHNLVHSYPKGLGIIKEFIQNADDASASTVKVVLDEREFSTEGLPDEMHWLHTTPALVIYNDSQFSKEDIDGIQALGASGKSQSAGKIGRFGLGFNVCYNVTDVPYFLTGDSVCFFDPHYTTVPGATINDPGRLWSLTSDGAIVEPLLRPFEDFRARPGRTFNGTAFRLPLRDSAKAAKSDICRSPFTLTDFEEIAEDFRDLATEILLFLGHVETLSLDRVGEDGDRKHILSVTTLNVQEVAESKDQVNQILKNIDHETLLASLLSQEPRSVHRHRLEIVEEVSTHTEEWLVVNGIFIDGQQNVLELAKDFFEDNEKAVPLAGAAMRVDADRSVDCDGHVCCFLPLPGHSPFPVTINGYFDLDDSRQNIFLDRQAKGAGQRRAKWNRLLMEHSVSAAYALLLQKLAEDYEVDWERFIKTWPDVNTTGGEWKSCARQVYGLLSTLLVIPAGDGKELHVPSEVRMVPDEYPELREPLASLGFAFSPGPIPECMREGFAESLGERWWEVKPQKVRDCLRVLEWNDTPISDCSCHALSSLNWVEGLCQMCLADESAPKNMEDVPLALTTDGILRKFLISNHVFLPNSQFATLVLPSFPDRFLDADYVRTVGLSEEVDEIDDLSGNEFSEMVSQLMSVDSECAFPWVSNTRKKNDEKWLARLFGCLANMDQAEIEQFADIPLVPDQKGNLAALNTAATPLLLEKSTQHLRSSLEQLGVPLVTADSELLRSLRDFQSRQENQFLWTVTATDLVDTIEKTIEIWPEAFEPETHKALLNWLSRDEQVDELRDGNSRIQKLKNFRLFPLATMKMIALDDSDAIYMPADFEFSNIASGVLVLDTGSRGRWRPLFELCGVQALTRFALVKDILLPRFADFSDDSRLQATVWLRREWERLLEETAEEEIEDFKRIVGSTEFISATDGKLHAPNDLYYPDPTIAKVLRDCALFPNMEAVYSQDQDAWLGFFSTLGFSRNIRIADVLSYIQQRVVDISEDEIREGAQALVDIYDFLRKNYERLQDSKPQTDDINWDVFVEQLSGLAWLPARHEAGELLGFKRPELRLFRACELHPERNAPLVCSQEPVGAFRESADLRVLGMPERPPVVTILAHLKVLMEFPDLPEWDDSLRKRLERTLAAVYSHIGARSQEEDQEAISNFGQSHVCLWDPDTRQFWKPEHIFIDSVLHMRPWRCSIRRLMPGTENGYTALGCKKSPGFEDHVQLLKELQNRFDGKILDGPDIKKVLEILRRFVLVNEEAEFPDDIPVPTQAGTLEPVGKVFFDDSPWFSQQIESSEKVLADIRIPPDMASSLGIKLLSESINNELVRAPVDLEEESVQIEASNLERNLQSPEFREGCLRLIRREHATGKPEDLDWLEHVQVRPVEEIESQLLLDGQRVGKGGMDAYFDPISLTFMLNGTELPYMADFLVEALNNELDLQRISDTNLLRKIISIAPEKIESYLTRMRVPILRRDFGDQPFFVGDDADSDPEREWEECQLDTDREEELIVATFPRAISDQHEQQQQLEPQDDRDIHSAGQPVDQSQSERDKETRIHRSSSDSRKSGIGPRRTAASTRATSSRSGGQKTAISYISPPAEISARQRLRREARDTIAAGRAGVDIVVRYETAHGREAEMQSQTNKGFDLISRSPGQNDRYIEVKGTSGEWQERGVSLSPSQFAFQRINPDKEFWLYVVDHVATPDRARVYCFRDPASIVTDYILDHGWKAFAKSENGLEPAKGLEIFENGEKLGVILEVTRRGQLAQLKIKGIEGSEFSRIFVPGLLELKSPAAKG